MEQGSAQPHSILTSHPAPCGWPLTGTSTPGVGWGQANCALLAAHLEPSPRNTSWGIPEPLQASAWQGHAAPLIRLGARWPGEAEQERFLCTSTAKAALGDCQAEPATVELIQAAASPAPLCCPSHLSLPGPEDFRGGTFAGCLEVLY